MSLGKKIAVGAAWSVFTRLLVKSLGFVSTVILARLLFPEDFGLIAATMTMVAFFEIFTNFSFDINIIQKSHITNDTLNSAWTCKLIAGAILAVILFNSSHWVANFFNDNRLSTIIQFVAFIPLLKSLENIGFVLYRKQLDLKKEFILEVTTKTASFIITISTAFILKSYWALVIGMYSNALSRVTLSYFMHPFRPRISLSQARDLFKFSKWLLLNNLLIFFNHKITDIIVGHRTSPTQLGHYSIAYEISNLPTTELIFPLSRAIFPGYAQVKDDPARLKEIFLKITAVIMLIAAPVCFGLYAVANDAVLVLLGEKWLPVAPLVGILSFYGLVRCSVQNIGSVFIAIGKPKLATYISLSRLILVAPIMYWQVGTNGVKGAAITILAASLITAPASMFICHLFLHFKAKEIARAFLFPLLASSFMLIPLSAIEDIANSNSLTLLTKIAVGAVLYASMYAFYVSFIDKANPTHNFIKSTIRKQKPPPNITPNPT